MESGVSVQVTGLTGGDEAPSVFSPAAAVEALPWREAALRVRCYWQALGVADDRQRQLLTEAIMDRLSGQAAEGDAEELARLGVKAVQEMINTWLTEQLAIDPQPGALASARTALLGGGMADWPGRLLNPQPPEAAVAARLRELMAQPPPPEEELVMMEQHIELRSLSPFAALRRLYGLLRPGAAKPSVHPGNKS